MSNYKIIADEEIFDDFIQWLPDLGPTETYYFQLFGRKKYNDGVQIKSGQQSLNRFVCSKERIKDKVRQLEVPLGVYKNRELELSQNSLVLYVTPNPRCHQKAAVQLIKELANRITRPYDGYNTHQLAITEVHRACGTKHFIDFDFDNVEYETLKDKIADSINEEATTVLKTRGGFHLLVRLNQVDKKYLKSWHPNLTALGADVKGDNLIPCPGTFQGGFIPHFIKLGQNQ